jgi:hypothetical protein
MTCRKALEKATERLGLTMSLEGVHRTFDRKTIEGVAIKLPGWNMPVIVDNEGTVHYDNYNGHWGNFKELATLTNYYGLEYAKAEAQSLGYYCTEGTNEFGELTLTIDTQEVYNV